MKTAPAFSDVLDAKLHAAGFEAVSRPHAEQFETTCRLPRSTATQPLTPSAFEVDSTARIAYRFGMGAFHSDRTIPSVAASPTRPAVRSARPLRFDTPAQRAALAALQALGARDLGTSSNINDLKRAFRLLARQLHPDSHIGLPDAQRARLAALFAEAAQAYRVLTEEQP